MSDIFFINPVQSDEQSEIQFLERWIRQAAHSRKQDGLLTMNLHRTIDPRSHFRFVILEHWGSVEAWEASQKTAGTGLARNQYPCPQYPGVYRLFSK